MKMYFIKITILILAAAWAVPAASEFAPYGCDVEIGDELYASSHCSHSSPGAVFNGVQGGAYFLIRFFQVFISPQDGANCGYTPTCSSYGRQAVEKHGAFLGSVLAGDRLIRCNPFNVPGRDPVPERVFGGDK